MSDEITIKLGTEIEHNGTRYTEITVREPTYGQLLDAQKKPVGEVDASLLASVTGWHHHAIAKLPGSKANAAVKAMLSFLVDGEAETSAS